MTNRSLVTFIIVFFSILGDAMKLDNGPPKLKKVKRYEPPPPIEKGVEVVGKVLTQNPISRIITNVYDFFYWLPRRNLLWDVPTVFWRNSTVDYIRWYQVPHNLPPYRYLDRDNEFMQDFFCYGLPGNTLPLGDWDPFGFNLVSKKVVLKYRESEIKHGRLAMLASCGIITQENFHPLHPNIGGLAITHMDQLANEFSLQSNVLTKWIVMIDANALDLIERLSPEDPEERRDMIEKELNHGRLAMVAVMGMIGQEYLTGYPVLESLSMFLQSIAADNPPLY